MNHNSNDKICLDKTQIISEKMGRRQLLKALTATGGAMALTQLPPNWVKSVVEVGTLPAHAQGSGVITVSNLRKTFTDLNDCTTDGGTGSSNELTFDYFDPAGNIGPGAVVILSTNFNTSEASSIDLFNTSGVIVDGNETQGSVTILLCTRFGSNETVTNRVRLQNTNGDISPTQSVTVSRPVNAQSVNDISSETLR